MGMKSRGSSPDRVASLEELVPSRSPSPEEDDQTIPRKSISKYSVLPPIGNSRNVEEDNDAADHVDDDRRMRTVTDIYEDGAEMYSTPIDSDKMDNDDDDSDENDEASSVDIDDNDKDNDRNANHSVISFRVNNSSTGWNRPLFLFNRDFHSEPIYERDTASTDTCCHTDRTSRSEPRFTDSRQKRPRYKYPVGVEYVWERLVEEDSESIPSPSPENRHSSETEYVYGRECESEPAYQTMRYYYDTLTYPAGRQLPSQSPTNDPQQPTSTMEKSESHCDKNILQNELECSSKQEGDTECQSSDTTSQNSVESKDATDSNCSAERVERSAYIEGQDRNKTQSSFEREERSSTENRSEIQSKCSFCREAELECHCGEETDGSQTSVEERFLIEYRRKEALKEEELTTSKCQDVIREHRTPPRCSTEILESRCSTKSDESQRSASDESQRSFDSPKSKSYDEITERDASQSTSKTIKTPNPSCSEGSRILSQKQSLLKPYNVYDLLTSGVTKDVEEQFFNNRHLDEHMDSQLKSELSPNRELKYSQGEQFETKQKQQDDLPNKDFSQKLTRENDGQRYYSSKNVVGQQNSDEHHEAKRSSQPYYNSKRYYGPDPKIQYEPGYDNQQQHQHNTRLRDSLQYSQGLHYQCRWQYYNDTRHADREQYHQYLENLHQDRSYEQQYPCCHLIHETPDHHQEEYEHERQNHETPDQHGEESEHEIQSHEKPDPHLEEYEHEGQPHESPDQHREEYEHERQPHETPDLHREEYEHERQPHEIPDQHLEEYEHERQNHDILDRHREEYEHERQPHEVPDQHQEEYEHERQYQDTPDTHLEEYEHDRQPRESPDQHGEEYEHERQPHETPDLHREEYEHEGQPHESPDQHLEEYEYERQLHDTPDQHLEEYEHERQYHDIPDRHREEYEHERQPHEVPDQHQKEYDHERQYQDTPDPDLEEYEHDRQPHETPDQQREEYDHERQYHETPDLHREEYEHERQSHERPDLHREEYEHERQPHKTPDQHREECEHERQYHDTPDRHREEYEHERPHEVPDQHREEYEHERQYHDTPDPHLEEYEHRKQCHDTPDPHLKECEHERRYHDTSNPHLEEYEHERKYHDTPNPHLEEYERERQPHETPDQHREEYEDKRQYHETQDHHRETYEHERQYHDTLNHHREEYGHERKHHETHDHHHLDEHRHSQLKSELSPNRELKYSQGEQFETKQKQQDVLPNRDFSQKLTRDNDRQIGYSSKNVVGQQNSDEQQHHHDAKHSSQHYYNSKRYYGPDPKMQYEPGYDNQQQHQHNTRLRDSLQYSQGLHYQCRWQYYNDTRHADREQYHQYLENLHRDRSYEQQYHETPDHHREEYEHEGQPHETPDQHREEYEHERQHHETPDHHREEYEHERQPHETPDQHREEYEHERQHHETPDLHQEEYEHERQPHETPDQHREEYKHERQYHDTPLLQESHDQTELLYKVGERGCSRSHLQESQDQTELQQNCDYLHKQESHIQIEGQYNVEQQYHGEANIPVSHNQSELQYKCDQKNHSGSKLQASHSETEFQSKDEQQTCGGSNIHKSHTDTELWLERQGIDHGHWIKVDDAKHLIESPKDKAQSNDAPIDTRPIFHEGYVYYKSGGNYDDLLKQLSPGWYNMKVSDDRMEFMVKPAGEYFHEEDYGELKNEQHGNWSQVSEIPIINTDIRGERGELKGSNLYIKYETVGTTSVNRDSQNDSRSVSSNEREFSSASSMNDISNRTPSPPSVTTDIASMSKQYASNTGSSQGLCPQQNTLSNRQPLPDIPRGTATECRREILLQENLEYLAPSRFSRKPLPPIPEVETTYVVSSPSPSPLLQRNPLPPISTSNSSANPNGRSHFPPRPPAGPRDSTRPQRVRPVRYCTNTPPSDEKRYTGR